MSPLERQILVKLRAGGPAWKRSFQACKSTVDTLIARKLVTPLRPTGGRARNMIDITAAGERALEALPS